MGFYTDISRDNTVIYHGAVSASSTVTVFTPDAECDGYQLFGVFLRSDHMDGSSNPPDGPVRLMVANQEVLLSTAPDGGLRRTKYVIGIVTIAQPNALVEVENQATNVAAQFLLSAMRL